MEGGYHRRVVQMLALAMVWLAAWPGDVCVSFAQESPSPATQAVTIVPFDYDPPLRPAIVVHVSINNSAPLPFLLDASGAYSMLVFEETADKLELAAPKRDKGTNASKPLTSVIRIPSTVSARSNAVLKSFEFVLVPRDGQARLPILVEDARRGKRPLWLAGRPGPRIAGMIGGALFLTCPSRLDFARREWTLYENAECLTPSTTANFWRFPMRHGKEAQAPLLSAALKAGGAPMDFEIVTAHAHSALPEKMSVALENRIRRQNFIPVDVFDGSLRAHGTLLSGISLDQLEVPELGVGFVSDSFIGALGTEFLERYRITFLPDRVGRKEGAILLEAREQYTPRLWGETGLTIESRPGDRILVTDAVEPAAGGSEGTRAEHIAVGDWLLSVDGTALEGLSVRDISRLLAGSAGSTATLGVQTPGGQPRTVRLVRARAADTVPAKTRKKAVIPFEYDPVRSPYIVVRLRINDGPPLPFVVDTGADGHLFLLPRTAVTQKLFVDRVAVTFNTKVTANPVYGTRAALVGREGEVPIETHRSLVFPWPKDMKFTTATGEPLAGVIGIRVLRPYTVQFDFARAEMRLFPPEEAPSPSGKETNIFMTPVGNEDQRFFVRGSVDNSGIIAFLIDTGAGYTTINNDNVPDSARYFAETVLFTALGRKYQSAPPVLLPRLWLGLGHSEPDIIAYPSEYEVNLLGLNLLSRYEVTLDFVNQVMRLSPPSNPTARRQPGTVDLRLGERKNGMPGWPVTTAFVDGTAYRAGIRTGDMLIAIKDTPLHETDFPDEVGKLSDGTVGSVAELPIRKANGVMRAVRVPRVSNLMTDASAAPFRRLAISFYWDKEGRIYVHDISTMASAQTGLRDNDRIVVLNQKEAKQYTVRKQIAALGNILERGGAIKVQRSGRIVALKVLKPIGGSEFP